MASKRWNRRNEIARSLGFKNYYEQRKANAKAKASEGYIDEALERAIHFRRELGFSKTRAAREAHIAPERLAAVEESIHVLDYRGRQLMITYAKDRGIVFAEMDEKTASVNGSYLNYVKWMFHNRDPKSHKAIPIAPITKANITKFKPEKIADFGSLAKEQMGGLTFETKVLYGTHMEGGRLVIDDMPEKLEGDNEVYKVDWEVNFERIIEYEEQRHGPRKSPYAKR